MLHDIGNTGTSTVSTSNKPSATDNKIQKTGVKRPLKGKGKYTARKSAGSVKKRPPNQRKRGRFSKIKNNVRRKGIDLSWPWYKLVVRRPITLSTF